MNNYAPFLSSTSLPLHKFPSTRSSANGLKKKIEDSHGDPAYQKKWFKAKRVAGEKGHPKSSPEEQRAPAQRARFIGSNQVSYKHCP
ncbi:hypothetical protein AVEN_68437-1 [Araneus ventricosus]|uniref:Uncharacterized protein n=2 Tax=Araneus ventricosus TaxID=182803 RepID=A0A4Y1ZMS4_ARAVE|nr:hypothetical protein AVEN_68437-1 [Araneus ventricosus]